MAKILIVDDSSFMRTAMADMFKKLGHMVVAEAGNGVEAIEAYRQHQPELVTMDITMPIMNGIEAVKKIVEINPEAKIIMISAITQKNQIMQAILSGARHYIIKPLTVEKLVEVTNIVLGCNRVKPTEEGMKHIKEAIQRLEKSVDQLDRSIEDINRLK